MIFKFGGPSKVKRYLRDPWVALNFLTNICLLALIICIILRDLQQAGFTMGYYQVGLGLRFTIRLGFSQVQCEIGAFRWRCFEGLVVRGAGR